MSRLLIDEYPLIVLPGLAEEIGLSEAIFLQQLHYWSDDRLNQGVKDENGRRWIYNSVDGWQKQMPFLSDRTLKRTIAHLEEMGLILSTTKYKRHPMDRTKAYSICHEAVDRLACNREKKQAEEYREESSGEALCVTAMPDSHEGTMENEAKSQSVSTIVPNWHNAKNKALEDVSYKKIKDGAVKSQSGPPIVPICPDGKCQFGTTIGTNWHNGRCQNGTMGESAAKADASTPYTPSSRARAKTTTEITPETPSKTTAATSSPEENARVRAEIRKSLAAAEKAEKDYLVQCQVLGVDEESARRFQLQFSRDKVLEKLSMLQDAIQRQTIKSPAGWLRRALEGDYQRISLNAEKLHRAHIMERQKARREAEKKNSTEAKSDAELQASIETLKAQIKEYERKSDDEFSALVIRANTSRIAELEKILRKRREEGARKVAGSP